MYYKFPQNLEITDSKSVISVDISVQKTFLYNMFLILIDIFHPFFCINLLVLFPFYVIILALLVSAYSPSLFQNITKTD